MIFRLLYYDVYDLGFTYFTITINNMYTLKRVNTL